MKRALIALAGIMVCGAAAAQAPPAGTAVTVQSAATTNATSTKTSAGVLYGFSLCNTSAAVKYFKFYNKASAPTVGTDAVALKVLLPAGACVARDITSGRRFTTGIAYAITGGQADSDTAAVAAGDVVGGFEYK